MSTNPVVKTSYFTFGFAHAHAIGGFTYDKDILVKITALDPRAVMVQWFGRAWSMEYEEEHHDVEELLTWCPRGMKEIG